MSHYQTKTTKTWASSFLSSSFKLSRRQISALPPEMPGAYSRQLSCLLCIKVPNYYLYIFEQERQVIFISYSKVCTENPPLYYFKLHIKSYHKEFLAVQRLLFWEKTNLLAFDNINNLEQHFENVIQVSDGWLKEPVVQEYGYEPLFTIN